MLVKVRLVRKEFEKKDGTKFNVWKAKDKDGKLIDVKFRKEVDNVPESSCVIVLNDFDLSFDSTKLYPCWWIKNIVSIEELERIEKPNVLDYFEEA